MTDANAPAEQPEPEPVAWLWEYKHADEDNVLTLASLQPWRQAWSSNLHLIRETPLYARSPDTRALPLTDEQIIEIRDQHLPSQGERFDTLAFGRAIASAAAPDTRALVEALQPFAALPFDATGQGSAHPDQPVYAINGVCITGRDILAARAALNGVKP